MCSAHHTRFNNETKKITIRDHCTADKAAPMSNVTLMCRSNGDLNNGEVGKKSPKSQLSGLHRELGAILKEIKVLHVLLGRDKTIERKL